MGMKKCLGFGVWVVALAAGALFSSGGHASQSLPKQPLFQPKQWLERSQKLSTAEVIALRDLITIHYDQNVGRPWKPDAYEAEYEKRFETFRAGFCPQVTALCKLTLYGDTTFKQSVKTISEKIMERATVDQINARLRELKSPVRMSYPVSVPGLVMAGKSDFNFILGEFASGNDPGLIRVRTQILGDVSSYYLGFMGKNAPVYFATDMAGTAYVMEESLIAPSIALAKAALQAESKTVESSPMNAPTILLQKYLKSTPYKLGRGADRSRDLEWLFYAGLSRILLSSVYAIQETQDPLVVLVKLQQSEDSNLLFFLMLSQSLFEGGVVLDQFAPKPVVNSVLRENLTALTGGQPYDGEPRFAKWSPALDPGLLFYGDEKAAGAFRGTNSESQRAILSAMVFPDEDEVSMPAFYRVISALVLSENRGLTKELAELILSKRAPKEKKPEGVNI